MKKNIFALLLAAVMLGGCSLFCPRGMITASEVKPAVDIVVKEYVDLKMATSDPIKADKIKMAEELKATVDLAAGGE